MAEEPAKFSDDAGQANPGHGLRRRDLAIRSEDIINASGRIFDQSCFVDDRAPWIDRPDYEAELARRKGGGQITEHQSEALGIWRRFGALHLPGLIDHALLDRLWQDYEQAWAARLNVPVFFGPQGNSYSYLEHLERKPGPSLRFFNFHHFSAPALQLMMHPAVLGYARLLLDETPLGMQTLTYERSSEQNVHADYVPVRPEIPSHLIGCWIACEEIHPDAGPLIYYPGSHRIDHFAHSPQPVEDFVGPTNKMQALWLAAVLRHDLPRWEFRPKKGDVLFWHAKLLHGGAKMKQPALTRKSFVCHYTSLKAYPMCNFYTNVRLQEMNGGQYFALVD